jgi:glycosyltransferase involved in cell wall biosynthesis
MFSVCCASSLSATITPMRILHLTPYYTPAYRYGGVVRAVEGMTRALARRGHEVSVLTTDALDQQTRYSGPVEEVIHGVRVIRAANLFPGLRGRFNLSTPNKMAAQALALLPTIEVVHCHEFRTVENLMVTPLAKRLNKPLALSPHGTLSLATGRGSLKKLWDSLLSSAVALRFDGVVTLSKVELEDVQMLWPQLGRRRIPVVFKIIPNGVDPDEYAHLSGRMDFRKRYGLGESPVCLFMGRLHERKGAHLLVEAFKAADARRARLVLAGPDEGMLERLRPQFNDHIVYAGFLSGAERLAAFAAADLLALPAVGEGLPMVVLEAMAAGLPVIVTPGCNLPEVVEVGAGLEVEAAVEPLTAALSRLLDDEALRRSMGMKAQRLIDERFTWDGVAGQLEAFYRQLIERDRSSVNAPGHFS